MRSIIKGLMAFGLAAGATAVGIPGHDLAKAQGYFDAPGVHVRIGHRYHHRYPYYRGYGSYAYAPRGYGYSPCGPYRTLQDGVCKPYRGY